MAKPLIVNVIELLRWPGSSKDIAVEVAADDFEFEDARIVSEPIAIAVHMEAITNGVSVSGVAHAAWAGECRRCLTPLRELMQVEFDEMCGRTFCWPFRSDRYAARTAPDSVCTAGQTSPKPNVGAFLWLLTPVGRSLMH